MIILKTTTTKENNKILFKNKIKCIDKEWETC